jgi:hypothetical protein
MELTGPLVHLANRRYGMAAGSALLRALPAAFAALWFNVAKGECTTDDYRYGTSCSAWGDIVAPLASIAGIVALIDDTAFMRAAPVAPHDSANVTPVVSIGTTSWVGLRGTF